MTLVTLNGEARELPRGATVETAVDLLDGLGEPRGVAVALDGEVVPRGEWASTEIGEGQQVEVVRAVQGGR
jgi:sulfur carrier protein